MRHHTSRIAATALDDLEAQAHEVYLAGFHTYEWPDLVPAARLMAQAVRVR